MRDKLKGLVLGLLIGVLLMGSAAYAGGTTVEALVRKFTIMMNGVEQQPKGDTLLYNNKVYVPIRFVGDILGEEVTWDGKTGTVWIGGKGVLEVVATYENKQVLQKELDKYLLLTRFLNPQYEAYEKDPAYVEFMLNRLIGFSILASKADPSSLDTAKANTNLELERIKQSMNAAFGSDTGYSDRLKELGIEQADLYPYLLNIIAGQAVIESSISDDEIQAQYTADQDAYTSATVSHILIALSDPDGQELRTKEEALTKATEIRTMLDRGSDFAELARSSSDDPGSASNGGTYTNQPVTNWITEFMQAVLELPLHTVSDPVETEYGYHLIRVDDRTIQPLVEVKEQIKDQLLGAKVDSFFNDELSGLIQSITLPKLGN